MPSLTISLSSWTSRRFAFRSVCSRCLSYPSYQFSFCFEDQIQVLFNSDACVFFYCPKLYNALFIGLGAVSLMVNLILVVSSSGAFCLACSFWSMTSSSVSIVSSGRKKSCSSSATSVDCRLTCIGRNVMSSLTLSSTRSLGFKSILDKVGCSILRPRYVHDVKIEF